MKKVKPERFCQLTKCAGTRTPVVAETTENFDEEDEVVVSRRGVLAATTALPFAGLLANENENVALAEETISSWEQVTLPVNPGVVLLDMAFVPEQPNRGLYPFRR